jgi:hypothetical protein
MGEIRQRTTSELISAQYSCSAAFTYLGKFLSSKDAFQGVKLS